MSSTRSTGLRPRQSLSAADPPVSLSPSNRGVLPLEPTKARAKAATPFKETPLTPTISNAEPKKKSWVSSASKSLGLNKLRHKTSTPRERVMTDNTGVSTHTLPSRQLIPPQSHNLAGSTRSPVPAPLSHQLQTYPPVPAGAYHLQHPSPPQKNDKPLPSLPVATIKYQSPVRRSLIDCAEKPLRRRSVTPPDGGEGQEVEGEDWPIIEPTKSDKHLPIETNQTQIKPSLGESLYEGMRTLNLRDSDGKNIEDKAQPDPSALEQYEDAVDAELLSDGRSRPLSSGQLPKPRDSMVKSLSRHANSPVLRHTKASAMRMQKATGRSPWDPNEKNKSANLQIPPIQEQGESSVPRNKQDFQAGPVRANSRGRYGVTVRGSPYTIPTRTPTVQKPSLRNDRGYRGLPHAPAESHGSNISDSGHGKQPADSPASTTRKSSLPLPARLVRQSATLGDEDYVAQALPAELPASVITTRGSNARFDDEEEQGMTYADQVKASAAAGSSLMQDPMSSPAPDTKSFVDSDEETSGVSVHGHDDFGGFRIRRVGNNGSMMGPTLRITDSASRVLLGSDQESQMPGIQVPNTLRSKISAPEVSSPRMTQNQMRRSSAVLTSFPSPVDPMRTLSGQSTGHNQSTEEVDARQPMNSSTTVGTVIVRAELPGGEINSGSESDFESSANPAEELPRSQSNIHDTPKSDHGDWPAKSFSEFNPGPDTTPTAAGRSRPLQARPWSPGKRGTPSPSRPPTIVSREAPSRETAPFLFQDIQHEKAKQDKLVTDFAKIAGSSSESSVSTQPATTGNAASKSAGADSPFPPRTSSRKPKPTPIVVPSPQVAFQSALPAPKAYAVRTESLRKPKNVKTFSRSVSPQIDSSKGRKISGVLAHTSSTSGKKKMVSSLRGLFHKKSSESNPASAAKQSAYDGETEPLPYIPALVYENDNNGRTHFRRKPLPGFTPENSNRGKRTANPLKNNNSATTAAPGTGLKPTQYKNSATSPTTPWTANLKTPNYPPSSYPVMAPQSGSVGGKPPSPTATQFQATSHAHPSPSIYSTAPKSPAAVSIPRSPSGTPASTPVLATATHLTHHLLDLARMENDHGKKAYLIELSKVMVELVSAARDSEKAMERAKMEAQRAEVFYLKCLREIGRAETCVRGAIREEGEASKEV